MRIILLHMVLLALVLGQFFLPVHAASKITGHAVEQKDAIEAVTQASYTRDNAFRPGNGLVRVIVQLEEAPLLEFSALNKAVSAQSQASAKSKKIKSVAAKEYKAFIQSRQEATIEQIESIDKNFKTDFRYTMSFNGFAGAVSEKHLEKLSAMPGIKAIYPDVVHYAHMDASLDIVNSMVVWEELGGRENAGKGVRVAVIDSGIRPENPMFSGDNFEAPDPATLPDDDYCALVPSFCNNKLIVARFADIPAEFDVHVSEFTDSPLAFDGHGTHVAGIAVGNFGVIAGRDGATAEISGVAPAAYLMVYKGLYATNDNPTRSSGLSSMLLDMLEKALNDGADVINNSWGSSAGESPAGSVYETVLKSIREAGIVNVFSAGNSGPGEMTIGCPACSDDVLSVGNTTTDRLFANEISIPETGLDPIPAILAGVVQLNSPLTATIRYSAEISPTNIEGCDAFPSNAFNNQIALISRGTCTFAVKIANAEAAGAIAVLIHNQAGRGEAPFVMGGLSATQRIPSLMLPATPGLALAEYLVNTTANTSATIGNEVIRTTSDSLADIMAESSSRGPGGDPSFLKPNLVAPGSRIFSAESPVAPNHIGEQFSFKTGTSMAAPQVAGAAALLKQRHPDWSVRQIESALVSSSIREILKEDAITPADNFDMGAGRLDIARASSVELTFSEISLVESGCFLACDLTTTVTNTSNSVVSVSPMTLFDDPTVIARVSPENLSLAAGESRQITVTVDVSLAEVSQWVLGGINWQDSKPSTTDYYLPIAVLPVVDDQNRLFTASASVSSAEPGETVGFTITGINEEFSGIIDITTRIDQKFNLAPDSLAAQSNGVSLPISWDEENREIIWQGELGLGSLSLVPSSDIADVLAGIDVSGYFSMSEVTQPLVCSGACDDAEIEVIHPPITYFGSTYTSMKVSSNGFVSMGRSSGAVTSAQATLLPSVSEPNGVLAPFWADLDLDGSDLADSGNGEVYAVELNTGHFVVEWKNAQVKGQPGLRLNFQIWFDLETGTVNFVYGPMDVPSIEEVSSGIVVGAENALGNVGVTYAAQTQNELTGSLPTEGVELRLSSTMGDSINISFSGTLGQPSDFMDDNATLDEDTTISINVLANDANMNVLNVSEMRTLTNTLRTVAPVEIDVAPIDSRSVTISQSPQNGSVTVATDGVITYLPDEDFFGSDTLIYSVSDINGNIYGEGRVSLTIEGVQDAPLLTITAPSSVTEGETVTISASATDADGDPVIITIDGVERNSFTTTAPNRATASSISVAVEATDGINITRRIVSIAVNARVSATANTNSAGDSGGGGAISVLTLFCFGLLYIRRKAHPIR